MLCQERDALSGSRQGGRAQRAGGLFFWRDRTREIDFVTEAAGRVELFEAKWTEIPASSDTVNLQFVANTLGPAQVTGGGITCRAANPYPLDGPFQALSPADLG